MGDKMREIKFRAWDIKDKVMLDWLTMRQTAFNRGECQLMYNVFTNRLNTELMQYTGLKDKNGKEVYEGDILKYSNRKNHHTEFNLTYVVEFGEQDLGHSSFQQTIGWNATHVGQFGKESSMDSGRLSKGILDLFGTHLVEVIGNIYENPELLN